MNDTAGKGILSSGGSRPPFSRYLVQLYSGDPIFSGLVDFALIGGLVMLFMHPPSMNWLRGGMASNTAPAAPTGAPSPSAPASGTATPKGAAHPSQTAAKPPTATPGGTPTPQSLPPAQSGSAVSGGVAMPLLDELKRPQLFVQFLFEIDETVFRNSEPEDRPKLRKAVQAYRAYQYNDMLDSLAGARSSDPNVAFMRGVAALYARRGALAENLLRAGIAGGHVQAGTILGVVQVAGNAAIDKDVEGGKRLIERAAAKGDRTAMRAAGIGYLTGQFGVLDPFKAADYFKRAVAAGDIAAMPLYAHMMFVGTGIERDELGAEELIEKAATAGLTLAQETLGNWIIDRYKAGVISDPNSGVHWLEQAYERGHSISALNRLAVFYADEGRGPQWRNRAKALEMFSMSAAFLDGRAQFGYATSLQFGYGGERDLTNAYARYELARQISGLSGAKTRMKTLDDLLSPAEKTAALDSARLIRQHLKSIPRVIVLQYPDLPQPESPWVAPPPPAPRVAAPALENAAPVAGNAAPAETKVVPPPAAENAVPPAGPAPAETKVVPPPAAENAVPLAGPAPAETKVVPPPAVENAAPVTGNATPAETKP